MAQKVFTKDQIEEMNKFLEEKHGAIAKVPKSGEYFVINYLSDEEKNSKGFVFATRA